MDINKILEFLVSYPFWAKGVICLCVVIIILVLIFTPRTSPLPKIKTPDSQLSPEIEYTGRVTNTETHKSIHNAKVTIEQDQKVPQVLYTDSDGIFHLKLPTSTKSVRIRVEAIDYEVFNRNISLSRTGIEDIRLTPIKPSQNLIQPPKEPLHRPQKQSEDKTTPQEPHPLIKKLAFVSEEVSSPSEKQPYGLRVTIQTNTPINPVHLKVECDGRISEGHVKFARLISVMSGKMTTIRNDIFEFSFTMPPFTPQTPLVVTLFSRTRIQVQKISEVI